MVVLALRSAFSSCAPATRTVLAPSGRSRSVRLGDSLASQRKAQPRVMLNRPNDKTESDSSLTNTPVLRPSSPTRATSSSATSLRPFAMMSLCGATRFARQPASRAVLAPSKSKQYPLPTIHRVAKCPPTNNAEPLFSAKLVLPTPSFRYIFRPEHRASRDHLFAACSMYHDLCLCVDRTPGVAPDR